ARGQGITQLRGDVLAGNTQMLRVAGGLAAETPAPRDGVVEVRVATDAYGRALDGIQARDRVAGRASLRPLLAPTSVAVVGAGRTPGGVGHEVLTGLVGYGFVGPVYAVNPHADA